ncbi:MAG: ATP-binding protein [Candidatus Methanoperedens sp.]|nr:ATP-binding protein [Candidatus Methanoperedens sp.]
MLFNNKKILLILILMIVGLIIALYAMSSTIVMNGFSGVEDQDTRQNVERVINVLSDDQSGLNKTVNDWSQWDEMYSFTLNRNDKFITSFLYDEEFGLLDVNLIMVVNSSGQIFFVKSIDIETMQKMTFLNSSLQKLVIQDGGTEPVFSGMIYLPEGLMMIAGRPILTSNGSGPSPGTLIMGRFFDSREINELANTTRLDISASAYNDQKMPADFQAKLPLFKKDTNIVIGPLNEEIIAGYTLIRDIYGNPTLVLRVDMPRFIYKQGRESLNYFLVSLLAVGLVFGVVVGSLLKKLTLWESITKESEERYRTLIETSPDGIFLLDVNSKITMANQMTAALYGYGILEEIVGKNISDMIIPEDRQSVQDIIHRVLETRSVQGIEFTALKKGDQTFSAEVRLSLTLDVEKKPRAIVAVVRDITYRKKVEALYLENLRLEAADKAKSEFLASMSHELRTPLTTILGFSELMKRGKAGKLAEKQERFIDNIFTAGTFLLNLINEILDLSKIEAGKVDLVYEKVSLPETIKETLNLIKEKAREKKVLINMDFDPELGFIEADKQRIKQMLFNLLSNAVKFSKEEGGVVTIATKKEGDKAMISITDTGIGIKEENIGRLFHKFVQLEPETKQKYGGTGLGLAITRQLVELHGGEIRAESTYGKGSTFTLIIPIEVKRENA